MIASFKNNITSINRANDENIFIVVCSFIFLIAPLPTIVLVSLVLLSREINTKKSYFFLFVLLAFYMGAINATKTPEADQIAYYYAYQNIPTRGFLHALSNIYGEAVNSGGGKEFMFGFINYVGYYLSFGYYPLFIFGFITALYMFLFSAIYKFYSYVNNRACVIIAAVFLCAFFTQYFNLTLQLQRQFLAGAIMMYVLVVRAADKKNLWWLGLIAVFTHTSAGLFFPLLFIKPLTKRLRLTGFIVLAIMAATFFVFSPQIGAVMAEATSFSSSLSYGFDRMAMGEANVDEATGENYMFMYSAMLLVLALIFIILYRHRKENENPLFFIYNTLIILVIFFFTMYSQPLTQYRYFMAAYSFFPFIFPNFFYKKSLANTVCLAGITLLLFVRFFLTFENIIWHYAPVQSILSDNIFSLVFNKHY